jgi:hypothetical protein
MEGLQTNEIKSSMANLTRFARAIFRTIAAKIDQENQADGASLLARSEMPTRSEPACKLDQNSNLHETPITPGNHHNHCNRR